MSAATVNFADKQAGDLLFALEVNALRDALNQHARLLDNPSAAAKLYQGFTRTQAVTALSSNPPSVVPGLLYGITASDWNGSGQPATVYVLGQSAGAFSLAGELLVGNVRSLVQVDVLAATAVPAQVDAYTKAEADALLATKASIYDVGYLPGLLTSAKYSLVAAINELVELKTSAAVLLSGATSTPYALAQNALNVAQESDILLLRGSQPGLVRRRSLTLDATGAHFGATEQFYFSFPIGADAVQLDERGGASNGRNVVVRQNNTCSLVLTDRVLDAQGYYDFFALGSDSPHVTTTILRRNRGRRNSPGLAVGVSGCLVFKCRNDAGQRMSLVLEDSLFESVTGSVVTGIIHPDARIMLRGSTTLTPAAGFPVFNLTNATDGSPADLATIVVDQRPRPRDVYGYSQAKRDQVLTQLFTSPTQARAVDVVLAGDNSTGIGSRIPDFQNGDVYELFPDRDNPVPDPANPGQTIGAPTWLRTSFS